MKKITLLLFMVGLIAQAQIPTGYYDHATGTGYTLKTQLKRIINSADDPEITSNEYQSSDLGYSALYTTFELSDRDIYFDHDNTDPTKYILDMYSEKVIENGDGTITNVADDYEYIYGSAQQDDGTLGTAEGQRFNREHIIPQSVFNSASPMRNDAHFVVPSDKYVNAQRGNLPYGVVPTPLPGKTYSNGSKIGPNSNSGYASGYSSDVFEPIDEFKGDIARMYFYFVTRYEDQLTSFNSYDMFNGSANQALSQPFLDILYNWHVNDPVSQRELDRNNAIYSRQNNRNPFIDHPEYVAEIWQNVLANDSFSITNNKFNMFPNPLNQDYLTIQNVSKSQLAIYDVLGKKVFSTLINSDRETINLSQLKAGMYFVKINGNNKSVTKKLIRK